MSNRFGFLPLLAVFAVACASPAPTPSAAPSPTAITPTASPSPVASELSGAQFSVTGGCGDAYFWAATPDGTTAITFQWSGAATNAWNAGGFHQITQLPDANLHIRVVSGSGLNTLYCNDVLEPGQGEASSIDVTAGAAETSVRPDAGAHLPAAHADAVVQDLRWTVTTPDGPQVWHLDEIVWQNVSIGWLAG